MFGPLSDSGVWGGGCGFSGESYGFMTVSIQRSTEDLPLLHNKYDSTLPISYQ